MPKKVRVLSNVSIDAVPFDALFAGNEPVILKGVMMASQCLFMRASPKCGADTRIMKRYQGLTLTL